jgi:hypothetical protein
MVVEARVQVEERPADHRAVGHSVKVVAEAPPHIVIVAIVAHLTAGCSTLLAMDCGLEPKRRALTSVSCVRPIEGVCA